MYDLNSTLLRPFLEGIGPIEKQNWGRLVGSLVCATSALNRTISGEELGRYKKDLGSPRMKNPFFHGTFQTPRMLTKSQFQIGSCHKSFGLPS